MNPTLCLGASSAVLLALGSTGIAVERPVRVLVDRSHEWLFSYDDLSERMLRPAGFEVVLSDASLNTKAKLNEFDIVLVHQVANAFAFSDDEVAMLTRYVAQGGRLVLVGSPHCPIRKLAAAFGLTLSPRPCKLPLRPAEELRARFGAEAELRTRAIACCVVGPPTARNMIADQEGAAVALKLDVGNGCVVCFADDGAYWDFCAQRGKDLKVPNVAATVALFKCLVPDRAFTIAGPPVLRIPAERELDLGPLVVRYSNPVALQAKAVLEVLPKVASLVAGANGGKPSAERFIVNILAANGGGWSGGQEVGIQCGGSVAANVAVIAHELTHSWTGPLPGIVGEGWASMVGMRAAAALGHAKEADRERRMWREQFERAEQGGSKLDITAAEKDRRLFGACEGKMMWIIEKLEARYGADFMPRFLEIKRSVKGRESLTLQETLYYFSLTVGEDLTPLFRNLGTTVQPPEPVSAEELRNWLERRRQNR